jgi:hypothetical protein
LYPKPNVSPKQSHWLGLIERLTTVQEKAKRRRRRKKKQSSFSERLAFAYSVSFFSWVSSYSFPSIKTQKYTRFYLSETETIPPLPKLISPLKGKY